MHFDKFHNLSTFQCWKTSFEDRGTFLFKLFSSEAMLWIKEVQMVDSVDDHETSRSIGGHRFPNLEMVDAKIASAVKKIITNPHVKKRVNQEEQKAQMQDRFLQ